MDSARGRARPISFWHASNVVRYVNVSNVGRYVNLHTVISDLKTHLACHLPRPPGQGEIR